MRQLIILILFLSPTYNWGQGFCKDSFIIYQNFKDLRQNPYLDSIYVDLESVTAYIDWQECPDFYFEKDSQKKSLEDSLKARNILGNQDTFEYIAYCQIYVDWEGILREVKVIGYKGNIDLEDIHDFFKDLKFEKLKRMGYGIDSKCVIPVRKNKN